MEIKFEIKSHCIQTEAKKRYERLMSDYFKQAASDSDLSVLEGQIEALLYFLEHADFGYLRGTYSFLNENQGGANVILHIPDSYKGMTLIHDRQSIPIVP